MKPHNPSHQKALEPVAQSLDDGAPPSNTAPTNYNASTGVKILRQGIDSLYLSFQGHLSRHWEEQLQEAKINAQSSVLKEQIKGQITIYNQLFEVKPSGRGRFKYVLVDNWFQIHVSSRDSKTLPLAYIQISSELLTLQGVNQAVEKLLPIINTLGEHEEAKVSRIDLCVDFTSPYSMDSWTHEAWVTRAHHIDPHYMNYIFTGWSIGQGGLIICRLYNKSIELSKSKKDYLKALWIQAGWNGVDDVWRCEFQIKTAYFKNMDKYLNHILTQLDALWQYALLKWCRLTIPNPSDSARTRWPLHPLWEALATVDWRTNSTSSSIIPAKTRAPTDDYLFVNGMGAITSFMAREGITDLSEGIGEYLHRAYIYHEEEISGSLDEYTGKKVKEKQRKFNTYNHNKNNSVNYAKRHEEAENYRKGKDGEE